MLKLNLLPQKKCPKHQILDHLQGEVIYKTNFLLYSFYPFYRNVTEIYTASTFLEDLYDETNRTYTIAAISKGSCLALTPVLGKLILTRFPDKSLRDVLNNIEPFEVVTNKTAIDHAFCNKPESVKNYGIIMTRHFSDLVHVELETILSRITQETIVARGMRKIRANPQYFINSQLSGIN